MKLEEKHPQCGLCSQVFERQCDLGKHICSEAIKMFNEKSTKKSNKAITITDTIKDIMTKNSPVSSPLEIKSDENTSVTNLVTNNDTIMDVEEDMKFVLLLHWTKCNTPVGTVEPDTFMKESQSVGAPPLPATPIHSSFSLHF